MSATPHDQPERAIVHVSAEERSIVPYQEAEGIVVGRTVLKPSNLADQPGWFRQCIDSLRRTVGLRSLELADRYAEAKVVEVESANAIKMMDARKEYEKVMAEVRERDRKGAAEAEVTRAVAERKWADVKESKTRVRIEAAKARQEESRARMTEHVERLVKAGELGPEAAKEWLEEVISKIEFQHGGRVEVQLPTPPGKEADDEGDEK